MPDYSKTRIQFRRGTAAELAAANPVLGQGEPAFATDTNNLKVGDGSTAYSSLSAISGGGGGGGGISNLVEDTTPQLGGALDTNSQDITGGIRSDTIGIDLDSSIATGTPLQVYDFADTQPFFAVRAGSAFISAIFGPSSGSANNRIQYYSSNTTTGDYWRQDANSTTYSLTRVDGNTADDTIFSIVNDKIGINTPSPSHKLSITDSTLLGGILVSGGGTPGLSLIDTTDDSSHGVYGSDNGILLVSADITSVGGSSSAIKLGVQNATQAVVTSSGVGIGTETPAHKLDVAGMGRFVHADGMCGLQIEDTGGSGIHIGDCALGSVTSYAGMKHSNHGASDYMMISNGVTTFLSAVNNGAVVIRGGGNDSANEIQVKDVGAGVAGIIFNEAGADRDIRMEGSTEENLFYVDASTDRIGIGTATPAQVLDVTTAQTEITSFNYQSTNDPVASGDRQSVIVEQKNDSIITKHLENTSNGSSTLVLKNLIRYGADFISIDDAYTTGMGTTYNPKLKVNTDTGAITFNDDYTFPTADGSADQVLQTDGAGNVSFATLSSVESDTSAVSNSTQVNNIVMITQTNYDALGSYDSNTLYFIT